MTEMTTEITNNEDQALVEKQVKQVHRTLKPRVDLYEAEDVILLVADLPGVNEDDINITLEKDHLTINGAVNERAPEGFRRVYSEFCYGDYERSFVLSNEIDRDNIEARFDNGVLTLSLPKAETAKARKITIQNAGL
jgi:HSP20 family molecular chaperone IbpA